MHGSGPQVDAGMRNSRVEGESSQWRPAARGQVALGCRYFLHGEAVCADYRARMRRENPSLIGHVPRSLLGAIALLSVATTTGWAASPNILFLFADDQCHETIRSLGGVGVETPNLDRLVRRGTAFTHAYNMGSWSPAVCVASRTMLVTGRSVWRANAIYNATDKEREAGRPWPQLMSKVGYATYFTGKWHIKADATKVFDVAKHIRAGMPKDAKEGYNRPLAGQPDPWSPYDPEFGGYWEGGRHWSEVVGDDTVEFLGEAKGGGKPFFKKACSPCVAWLPS